MPGKGSVGKKNLARNGIRTVMFFSSLLPHCFNIRLARNFYQLMSSVIKLMTHFLLPHLWISVSIWVSVFGDGAKLVVDNQLFPLCLMSESCFISVSNLCSNILQVCNFLLLSRWVPSQLVHTTFIHHLWSCSVIVRKISHLLSGGLKIKIESIFTRG